MFFAFLYAFVIKGKYTFFKVLRDYKPHFKKQSHCLHFACILTLGEIYSFKNLP